MAKSKKVQFTRKANGEGSVYQMKDGRFGAAVSLGKDSSGKRLRYVETGKTEQDVIDKMKLWLAKNGYMSQQTVVINGMSPLKDFIEDYKVIGLRERNNEDVTIDNYCNLLNVFQNFFFGAKLGQIDSNEIERFFVWMVNDKANGQYHYGPVAVSRLKGILNRMFKRGVKKGYLQANPINMDDLKDICSKKRTKHVKGLSNEEMEIVKSTLGKNEIIFPVITLMLVTGMRTQEALALQWGDVDFEKCSIHIQRAITKEIARDEHGNKVSSKTIVGQTKTGSSERVIEVPSEVIEFLLKWKEKAPKISKTKTGKTDFVFGSSKDSSWTYGGFRSSVNRCLRNSDLGMDSLALHRLRHTTANKMSHEPGVTVFDIMQLLGHTEIQTTQKYIDEQTEERSKRNKEFIGHMSAQNGLLGVE